MKQDSLIKADQSDILTDTSPPAAQPLQFAPFRLKRPIAKIPPLHRMQWAPRPAALSVGEYLGIEGEVGDEEAGGQGSLALPSRCGRSAGKSVPEAAGFRYIGIGALVWAASRHSPL